MLVYRITKTIYVNRLVASGGAAHWNRAGQFVLYTAASRALACLENVVHRSGEGLTADFRVIIIDVPDSLSVETVPLDALPTDWFDFQRYETCQRIGEEWLQQSRSAVLMVPSAIISNESNCLLNPAHPDFSWINLLRTERFIFDPRLKL